MKRLLTALHRYLGASLCLLFAVWFASGIVMVFSHFPRLDEDRRLNALPELALDPSLPSPAQAFARHPLAGRIRLGMLGARPVYRFVDGADRAGLVDARDPTIVVSPDDDALARLAAAQLGANARAAALFVRPQPIDRRDQWTTMAPAAAQFPLWRFDAADAAASQVYVSLVTAEVVQATTGRERLLAWVGPIPHWIYPIVLRRHAATWRRLVLALAGAGAALCLLGLVLGFWHWRPFGRGFRSASGARTAIPYRERWMRWHHIVGLAFGGLAFTWVGSGALSLNPGGWSRGSSPDAEETRAFSGGPLRIDGFVVRPGSAWAACQREIRPRELELIQIGGRPYYLCRQSSRDSRLVAADRMDVPSQTMPTLPALRALSPDSVLAAGAALWPSRSSIGSSIGSSMGSSMGSSIDVAVLAADDGYFNAEVDPDSDTDRASILRVRAGADHAVWYYVDLRTGALLARLDPSGRRERWLYHGFHSLDFPSPFPSWRLRPHTTTWYIVIVAGCAVGLFLSVTGVAVTLGWLARLRRRRAPAATIAPAPTIAD